MQMCDIQTSSIFSSPLWKSDYNLVLLSSTLTPIAQWQPVITNSLTGMHSRWMMTLMPWLSVRQAVSTSVWRVFLPARTFTSPIIIPGSPVSRKSAKHGEQCFSTRHGVIDECTETAVKEDIYTEKSWKDVWSGMEKDHWEWTELLSWTCIWTAQINTQHAPPLPHPPWHTSRMSPFTSFMALNTVSATSPPTSGHLLCLNLQPGEEAAGSAQNRYVGF